MGHLQRALAPELRQLRLSLQQAQQSLNAGPAYEWDEVTASYIEGKKLYKPRKQQTIQSFSTFTSQPLEERPEPQADFITLVKAKASAEETIDLREELKGLIAKITRKAKNSTTAALIILTALIASCIVFDWAIFGFLSIFAASFYIFKSIYDYLRKVNCLTDKIVLHQFHGVSHKDFLSLDWSKIPQGTELQLPELTIKALSKAFKLSDNLATLVSAYIEPEIFFVAEYNEDPNCLIVATTGSYSTAIRNLYIVPKWLFLHRPLIEKQKTAEKASAAKPNILDSILAQESFQKSYQQAKKELE